jgi:hypothetical protein
MIGENSSESFANKVTSLTATEYLELVTGLTVAKSRIAYSKMGERLVSTL